MKVAELIDMLRRYDPNQEVAFYAGGNEWSATTMGRLEFVKPVPGAKGRYADCSLPDGGLPLIIGL